MLPKSSSALLSRVLRCVVDRAALVCDLPFRRVGALADLNQSAFRGNGDCFRSAHGI
jgi:hypothetical protein